LSEELIFGEDLKRCRRRGEWKCSSSALGAYNLVLGFTARIKIMIEG
jgi:hypothetical protein